MTLDFSCGFAMAAAGEWPAADPNAATLKLALFGQGSDGTTQPVSDRGAKALTWYGDAAIRTAQSRFYGSSLAFDGTGDYISAGASSDFVVTGDFRVSFWVKAPAFGGSSLRAIMASFRETAPYDGWEVGLAPSTGVLTLYMSNGTTGGNFPSTLVAADNTWHFVEGGRIGAVLYLSVDGVVQVVGSYTGSSSYNVLTIGANSGGSERLTGYLQDVLFYNGIAPYQPAAGYADTYL